MGRGGGKGPCHAGLWDEGQANRGNSQQHATRGSALPRLHGAASDESEMTRRGSIFARRPQGRSETRGDGWWMTVQRRERCTGGPMVASGGGSQTTESTSPTAHESEARRIRQAAHVSERMALNPLGHGSGRDSRRRWREEGKRERARDERERERERERKRER